MSTARSAFTEAIEEHLALKKTNATLEPAMPLARYDVGDPLDRYPGGPNRAADGSTVVIADDVDAPADEAPAFDATQMMVGPSPEQAMEAATALEPGFGDRPFEPLNGLAPMLSLVEDIDEDADDSDAVSSAVAPDPSAEVLRFPGGVGPRDEVAAEAPLDEQLPMDTHAFTMPQGSSTLSVDEGVVHDAPTGEQPVLVIDSDEPLATTGFDEPVEPSRAARRSKPRFFGLGGRKKSKKEDGGDGWFTDGPRDFNWD